MKAVSIDIETTGLNINNAEILEVGMVAFDTDQPFIGLNRTNTLRIVIVKNNWQGEVYALNLNKDIIAEILQAQKLFKEDPSKPIAVNGAGVYDTVYVNVEAEDHWPTTSDFNKGVLLDLDYFIDRFFKQNKFEGRITVAGKNFAGFDGPFLRRNHMFGDKFMSRFRHKILDPGSMYVLPEDDQVPGLPLCLERAGLPSEVPHTAVEDAALVIKCIQAKLLK